MLEKWMDFKYATITTVTTTETTVVLLSELLSISKFDTCIGKIGKFPIKKWRGKN